VLEGSIDDRSLGLFDVIQPWVEMECLNHCMHWHSGSSLPRNAIGQFDGVIDRVMPVIVEALNRLDAHGHHVTGYWWVVIAQQV